MSTELVHRAPTTIAEASQVADAIATAEFVPKQYRGKPEQIMACVMAGGELGFNPLTSLRMFHNVQGTVTLSAEAQRSLVLSAGHHIKPSVLTADRCVMVARRKDDPDWTEFEYTLEDAERAGLTKGDGWRRHPKAMLVARCSALACRTLFSDVTGGIPSTEEVRDSGSSWGEAPSRPERPAPILPTTDADDEPVDAEVVPDRDAQLSEVGALFEKLGVAKDDRPAWICDAIGRTPEKASDLTDHELTHIIGELRADVEALA